ncbi:hypothetical protein LO772_00205 [Yinghuangia sp. ASG 101]|uniref:hypothetical protein n=1 Tax=Yinghuangia sp. ASG 101 TaxID=2896848 RepID=UPI001E65B500|nr:hypothetical protein [Yinghuangia sp. ASG 101]UGQ12076.1 hypothetical protein LO772_00205 [Yinghuangia sp. ASG 101]
MLQPESGVRPASIKPVPAQARSAAEWLAEQYADGTSLVLGIKAMLDDITWDKNRTDDSEAAWERLGRHLGFHSVRPEKQYGTGPDNLWVLSNTLHAVVELKTGCETDTIAKKDLDQLGGSVRWDAENYPEVAQLPVMLHPSTQRHALGISVPGMRVVTPDALNELKRNFAAWAPYWT